MLLSSQSSSQSMSRQCPINTREIPSDPASPQQQALYSFPTTFHADGSVAMDYLPEISIIVWKGSDGAKILGIGDCRSAIPVHFLCSLVMADGQLGNWRRWGHCSFSNLHRSMTPISPIAHHPSAITNFNLTCTSRQLPIPNSLPGVER